MIAKAFAADPGEARCTVHLSAAWAAERDDADRFLDTAEAALIARANQSA